MLDGPAQFDNVRSGAQPIKLPAR